LLRPVLARLEAQAEEIGTLRERTTHLQARADDLQAQLERTTARIAELEAPAVAEASVQQNAAAPHAAERRSWWRRLFSWDAAAGGA
jgi:predicted  nucleic acid-binding Zn-ribbon protein